MNVDAINPALLFPTGSAQSERLSAPAQAFSTWLDEQIRTSNSEIIAADDSVRRLAVGEPVNLHQVMVQLERARLQFELVLQVRNKLLDAYQDLLRMQI